jgi:hypothetical protein
VKNFCYGALDEVQMMDRLPFDIDIVSRCLRLPQEEMWMSSVAHLKEEDLKDVFEPNANTTAGYLCLEQKVSIKSEWLSFVNHRILLLLSIDHILEEGVAAALMAWNGMPLNWSKIVYNNMKLELMRKKTRGILSLYNAVFLTKMMDPTHPSIPHPPPVNLTFPITTEIGSTSKEPVAKKRKEYHEFVIRMRTQNPTSIPSTFILEHLEPKKVIVLGESIEETILEGMRLVRELGAGSREKESEE